MLCFGEAFFGRSGQAVWVELREGIVPRTAMGRTAYTPAEMREMTAQQCQAVREAHRPRAAVMPGEMSAELDAEMTAELDRQMRERLECEHREAS